jgi:hypothetical protein
LFTVPAACQFPKHPGISPERSTMNT